MTETTETMLTHPETIDEAIVEKLYPMNDVRVLLDKIVNAINPGLEDGTFMHDLLSLGIVLGFVALLWFLLRLLFVRQKILLVLLVGKPFGCGKICAAIFNNFWKGLLYYVFV